MSDIWKMKYNIIKDTLEELHSKIPDSGRYHYTSLSVLFSILDTDSFWISNVRFSNDYTEERLVNSKTTFRDDYIICLSDSDDRLSQWRGYCHGGGAAIEFNMQGALEYSILYANYDQTYKYELYENVPLPVIYVDYSKNEIKNTLEIIKAKIPEKSEIENEDIIPFLKNALFYEERELRMAFENKEGKLSKCVRFRSLDNGVKVPYMVVKSGNIGKMFGNCATNIVEYDDNRIKALANKRQDIWIEEGSDQENVFYEISKKVEDFAEKNPGEYKVGVYCKGHLPIKSITVAPTYDRERLAEQIQRFCKSKYWLHTVKVKQSEIPYVQHG